MNLTIQTRVRKNEAKGFILQMESQGFKATNVDGNVHFEKNGKVSADYSVFFQEEGNFAFIGVRPKDPD